jgi:dihydrodipicolinate reductase
MTDQLKIGIVGAAGRMGRMLVQVVSETESCVLERMQGCLPVPVKPAF